MSSKSNPKSVDKKTEKATPTPTKLEKIEALLRRPNGASIEELMNATGWQQHSVRGAVAGSLKKRGLSITSEKLDGVRRYSIKADA